MKSEMPPGGDDQTDDGDGNGDYGSYELKPGEWEGYGAGDDAGALAKAFQDGWDKRPDKNVKKVAAVTIVAEGNNPITGYSVILKQHGGP